MDFFEKPILNSPYKYPSQYWELDEAGQPTQSVNDVRRPSSLITPVPSAKARRKKSGRDDDQMDMVLDAGDDLSSTDQEYNISGYINEIRELIDQWRRLQNERDWQVTAETAQLLRYWRFHEFETMSGYCLDKPSSEASTRKGACC